MTLAEAILAVTLAMPAGRAPVEPSWAGTVSVAIAEAAERATCTGPDADAGCHRMWHRSRDEAAALALTVAWFETGLLERIQAGRCGPNECGSGRHGSRSLWQIELSPLVRSEWPGLVGADLEHTRNAATAAIRILGFHERRCRSIEGAIAGFATGRSCRWSGARQRLAVYHRVLGRIRKAQQAKGAAS